MKRTLLYILLFLAFSFGIESGSGVIVGGKYIITAYHVIEDEPYACMYDIGTKKCYPLDVVGVDGSLDIAILKFRNDSIPSGFGSCMLSDDTLSIGEPLVSYGFYNPFYRGVFKMDRYSSRLHRLDSFEGDDRFYQISVELRPGFSGGPTFDSHGRVIGIARSVYLMEKDVTNIVRSERVLAFMSKYGIGNSGPYVGEKHCTVLIANTRREFLGNR